MSAAMEALPSPSDGITSLTWSANDVLVATSWDCEVRAYGVQTSGIKALASHSHSAPVLCSAVTPNEVLSGGCDTSLAAWDVETGSVRPVGSHLAPIKGVVYVDEVNAAVSGSWDSTLKHWDLRSSAPVHDLVLPQRTFCMDAVFPLLAVGCAERQVVLFDLRKPSEPLRHSLSPLKYQTRSIAVFTDGSGYTLGSIEGRVAVQHVEEKESNFNFVFKCHRHSNNIYAVNAIAFHPVFGTFATAGSDGQYAFWDQYSKQRLTQGPSQNDAISAAAFSNDGTYFAYGVSYDWHRGSEFYNPDSSSNSIIVERVSPSVIKPRQRETQV